jgi:hypothetical protein
MASEQLSCRGAAEARGAATAYEGGVRARAAVHLALRRRTDGVADGIRARGHRHSDPAPQTSPRLGGLALNKAYSHN